MVVTYHHPIRFLKHNPAFKLVMRPQFWNGFQYQRLQCVNDVSILLFTDRLYLCTSASTYPASVAVFKMYFYAVFRFNVHILSSNSCQLFFQLFANHELALSVTSNSLEAVWFQVLSVRNGIVFTRKISVDREPYDTLCRMNS